MGKGIFWLVVIWAVLWCSWMSYEWLRNRNNYKNPEE